MISRRAVLKAGSLGVLATLVGCSASGDDRGSGALPEREREGKGLDRWLAVHAWLAVNARLDATYPDGPVRAAYRAEPTPREEVERLLAEVAPLRLPDELTALLRLGGWWPGELLAPESVGYFEQAVRLGPEPAPRITWLSFGSTWEQDVCYVPLLAQPVGAAPLGLWSTQMLQVSVPAPSIAALLAAFEIALEVFEQDEYGIEDQTWADLITAPPRPDPQVDDALHRRQLLAHERLAPLAETWTSTHPCWLASDMPLAWTDTPSSEVADVLLGTGS